MPLPDPSVDTHEPATAQASAPAEEAPALPPPRDVLVDEPAPPVQPIVLRGRARPTRPRRERGALRVPSPPSPALQATESLVDAIVRRVGDSLASALREGVHAAIVDLAPRMAVSLEIPVREPEPAPPAVQEAIAAADEGSTETSA